MLKRLVLATFALLAFMSSVQAEDMTFTGDVTYRERMALPDGAQLWVSLVALPENAVVASASATIGEPAQVPLGFKLAVRTTKLRPTGAYGLKAEIRSSGRTLFRNIQPVLVDLSAPSPSVIVVSFLPDAAHAPDVVSPAPTQSVSPLLDTSWRVTSIGGTPVLPETRITLAIAPDRRAGGHGGCNNYFTEASFEPEALSFGPIAGTRMACAAEVMGQEAALFAALEATSDFEATSNSLKLLDAAGVPLVGLVQGP